VHERQRTENFTGAKPPKAGATKAISASRRCGRAEAVGSTSMKRHEEAWIGAGRAAGVRLPVHARFAKRRKFWPRRVAPCETAPLEVA
jgi:hypothetical protein